MYPYMIKRLKPSPHPEKNLPKLEGHCLAKCSLFILLDSKSLTGTNDSCHKETKTQKHVIARKPNGGKPSGNLLGFGVYSY